MGMRPRSGGAVLVDQLRAQGVARVFCVPGESYLAVLDALHDAPDIAVITCRQEGGAAMMAEATAKLDGRPGVCLVTRGPGAANAAAGVHIAHQDSTPMILLIGQVERGAREREGFQEVEYRHMFAPLAKWVAEIDNAARIPELVARAFHVAQAGRPGPVVLALPEDMLRDVVTVTDAPRAVAAAPHPDPAALAELSERLARARRPLMIVGGGGWTGAAGTDVRTFARAHDVPIAAAYRCQDYVDNDDPHYVGHLTLGADPHLLEMVRRSDLLITLGARLGEITTQGFTLIDIPTPSQTLVHVHAGAEELGRIYQPALPINAGSAAFARALAGCAPAPASAREPDWRTAARTAFEAFVRPPTDAGALQLGEIVAHLRRTLADDAIIANGAGNYTLWVHRFFRYRRFRTQLAPTSGSMGYGVPAAIAAKLAHPERDVVSVSGDGCFLMHGQELATAVQNALAIVFLVVNNTLYGTIRLHQERSYPGRPIATTLANPDFAALARAYGAAGETVTRTDDFAGAFARARAQRGPALIELRLDPEAIIPGRTLSAIRAEARARTRAA